MRYTREPDGPVFTGDVLREGRVVGFGFHPSRSPDSSNDCLLLSEDQGAAKAPGRSVPENAREVLEFAPPPPSRVPNGRVFAADAIDDELPTSMVSMLSAPGRPWASVALDLFDTIDRSRHYVWIVGGAARDTISRDGAVNDLDLTGTAPLGRFSELARALRKRMGLENRERVSPDSLVCWAMPKVGGPNTYEYRPLNMPGWRFPVSCSDVVEDAECRDLTINTIYYDPLRHVVFDPVEGLADLVGPHRRLLSRCLTTDPQQQATVIVRTLKFILRWEQSHDLDLADMTEWVSTLPGEWEIRLDERAWRELALQHAEYLGDACVERQRARAERLGPAAAELLHTLLERAS